MRIKFILLTLTLITLSTFSSKVYSQLYSEGDKEGLRSFLRQESAIAGKTNIECLGLTPSDTINWNTSEDWIEKLQEPKGLTYIDWQWNLNTPGQLTRLEIKSFDDSVTPISGHLDCASFTSLEYLDCSNSQISGLNIRGNKLLRMLNCSNNEIKSIDTYENNLLQVFNCSGNQLKNIDLTTNLNLSSLDCSNNQIHVLNVFENVNLTSIACANNDLNQVILPNSPTLETLDCSNNSLSVLNLDKYIALKMLSLDNNNFPGISSKENIDLVSLYVAQNELATLDVSSNANLLALNASNNILTDLSLNSNTQLEYIYVHNNELENINLSSNTNLIGANFSFNSISSIYMPPVINSLQSFVVNNNNLKISTLPPALASSTITEFIYASQAVIDGGSVTYGDNIDLSSEYNIDENITVYKWLKDDNLDLSDNEIEDKGNGIFTSSINEDIIRYCHMTNPLYPNLTLVYKVQLVKNEGIGVDIKEDDIKPPFYYDKPSNSIHFNYPDEIKSVYIFDSLGRRAAEYTNITYSTISTEKLYMGVYLIKVTMKSGKIITQKVNI